MSGTALNNTSDIFRGSIKLQSQEIPFAYFPRNCSMEEFLNLMVKKWELDLPKIVLLIISDHASLKGWDIHKEQQNFVKGLVKGSNATSMWIFTNGLNIGISKVIGEAFQEDYNLRSSQICTRHAKEKTVTSKLPLIGLSRDTILTYNDQFETKEEVIHLENKGNIVEEQKFNLNPYHTNHLIVKDPTFDQESNIRFLLRLVDTLRHHRSSAESIDQDSVFPKSPIPIIAILIQGSMKSVFYILEHLKRKLPVLVIKGSGGLANILAYAYNEAIRCSQKINDKDYVETILRRGLNDKITSVFPGLKDNKMAQNLLCGKILECIKYSEPPFMKYITVLNISDLTCNMENLPHYLLEVLFKSRQKEDISRHIQLTKDLQLTLDWNSPEIALMKVFYKDPTFKIDKDIFQKAFLQKGREAFVSLFLDNGFEVHKYLNADRLVALFQHSLKCFFFWEVCWEGILGNREERKLDKSFIDSDLNWIIESLSGISIVLKAEELDNVSEEIFDKSLSKDIQINIAKQRALTVLIVWALVSRREELAMVLWQQTDNPIMTALISALILDKMQPLVRDSKTKEEVKEVSKKFASMAVGVFDLCYTDLPSKAYDSLNLRLTEWVELSLIDMASLSLNRTFVAHPCCQKWLTNKLMGNIKIRELSWGFITFPIYIKVILCAFLAFPMYLWVRFKEASIHEFVGADEFEKSYPSYANEADDIKRMPREEIGRKHLLKYKYPPLWQMIYYMWSAPITKFWVSNIFYMLYLALFTLAVIWPSCGNQYLDSIICLWTLLIAIHSLHQLYSIHVAFPNTPFFASCLEITYMLCFVLFYYLLRVLNAEGFRDPYTGKILICAALIYFYYRMIFIYLPISSTLGPLLYRVKTMITVDFVNFMKLVMFILMGNAIAMQAILYPDYPLIPELIRKSFHKAIVIFFITPVGELAATDKFCVTWEQQPKSHRMCRVSKYIDGTCSDGIQFWPYIIVFQYVLLMKLVLMTILFALFNATGARIAAETDSIWKFQRYKLVINFSYTLRLPPPLNIFSIFIIVCQFFINCCKKSTSFLKKKEKNEPEVMDESRNEKYLSLQEDAMYWKQLANDYYISKAREKEEKAFVKKELNILSQLREHLEMNEILVYRAQAQIRQLESDVCYTHARLETLKYRAITDDAKEISMHSLSRESPYPMTTIQRFLVPDKYVPWDVTWLHYEPIFYTMPKEEFPKFLQPYADDDVMLKGERKHDMPSFKWNTEFVDSNGNYKNRKSWITDRGGQPITYRLDKFDLPRNPMGRTGLRGKGALPRWGPNHAVFAIIIRRRKATGEKENNFMTTSDFYEYVETFFMKKKDFSLPGGFARYENKYEVIQSCFVMDEDSKPWETSEDMIAFFKDHAISFLDDESEEKELTEEEFTSKLIHCGYMDDQLNTDQAWKEVELWHFQYNVVTNLSRKFKANIRWKLLSEDIFTQLPYGQTLLLQNTLKHLNMSI